MAYLANRFPEAVEPYVGEEILELRRRGVRVIPGSVRKSVATPNSDSADAPTECEIVCLQPLRVLTLIGALRLAIGRRKQLAGLLVRVLLRGKESPSRRLKALFHTWLGACYAVQLRDRGVDHIHVHHGYFGSWIAMVAARLLHVDFSLTLHGSDLLLDGAYLDTKLGNCRFCLTISEYNRRYILQHYPAVDPAKIIVSRLGVDLPHCAAFHRPRTVRGAARPLTLLAIGRLHAVKDHAFLIRACARLRDCGLDFTCPIAGEGPERRHLESLILETSLQDRITLLGHIPRPQIDSLFQRVDVVVLTSRSEGIPLVLMEAMAHGRIVLAPAITGIPELVIPGITGFLYRPGSLSDFVAKIFFLQEQIGSEDRDSISRLDWIRHAARIQVLHNFDRSKNLNRHCDNFVKLTSPDNQAPPVRSFLNEDFVLQQI